MEQVLQAPPIAVLPDRLRFDRWVAEAVVREQVVVDTCMYAYIPTVVYNDATDINIGTC